MQGYIHSLSVSYKSLWGAAAEVPHNTNNSENLAEKIKKNEYFIKCSACLAKWYYI